MPKRPVTRRQFVARAGALAALRWLGADAAPTAGRDVQPYFADVKRAIALLARLGAPIAAPDAQMLAQLARQADPAAVESAERILNHYTLARIEIAAAGGMQIAAGGAAPQLVEQGWRLFLIRVANLERSTGALTVTASGESGLKEIVGTITVGRMSPEPQSLAQRSYLFDTVNVGPLIQSMWLTSSPEAAVALSGLASEYRVIQLFSRDRGVHKGDLAAAVTPAIGKIGSVAGSHRLFEFTAIASRDVALSVIDSDGRGCMASLTISDAMDRVYPPKVMRLAPDLPFQSQVYRADGENVRLPDGQYTITATRGPEYLNVTQSVAIGPAQRHIDVQLRRWIDPAAWGWYSGDTHIHAAGCAHYSNPSEGVSPETMIREVRGEGLAIGDILSWGPDWFYQKQFFTGHAESPTAALEHPELQKANNTALAPHSTAKDAESTLRYDVEVSGFPSSHAGHLVLLRLKDQDFPATTGVNDWPSWNLPILRWAKSEGAIAGYAHCGSGMVVDSDDLPNYVIPQMDGVGTQEAIIDVTHGVVDFLSGCDTNPSAELNAWYHLLNCGFRLAMLGETDYPCLSDVRPGNGRSYVRLDRRPEQEGGYEAWIASLMKGRLYCGDGRSHFLNFTVNGRQSGDDDVLLDGNRNLRIAALVAARLEPVYSPSTVPQRAMPGWGWHLEWARIGATREVPVELIVNGQVAASVNLLADGVPHAVKFAVAVERSSWVALRILPSAHTHPVFVPVNAKPIRASTRSAEWCRACVDKVWTVKSPMIRDSERPAAAQAFDHARRIYDAIIADSGGA
jgi:hypothetical protein